jgi:hypothetical protein
MGIPSYHRSSPARTPIVRTGQGTSQRDYHSEDLAGSAWVVWCIVVAAVAVSVFVIGGAR